MRGIKRGNLVPMYKNMLQGLDGGDGDGTEWGIHDPGGPTDRTFAMSYNQSNQEKCFV